MKKLKKYVCRTIVGLGIYLWLCAIVFVLMEPLHRIYLIFSRDINLGFLAIGAGVLGLFITFGILILIVKMGEWAVAEAFKSNTNEQNKSETN